MSEEGEGSVMSHGELDGPGLVDDAKPDQVSTGDGKISTWGKTERKVRKRLGMSKP